GFGFGVRSHRYSVLSALSASASESAAIAGSTLVNLGHALTRSRERKRIRSFVGITEVTQEAVSRGWGFAFVVLGFVSLALGLLNMLPFLPLDGGHVLWALAEKVRGRPVSLGAMWRFSTVGIVLMVFLVANGFYNDLTRLGA
ncbi:MAG: site-2 protease family protein, partial [Acidobacteriota bacterium]|nr:site-2 protease family protein [Acidobacteriota bacterium]